MSDILLEKLRAAQQLQSKYTFLLPRFLTAIPGILEKVDLMNASLVSGDWNSVRRHGTSCRVLSEILQREIHDSARLEADLVAAVHDLAGPLQLAVNELPGQLDPDTLVQDTMTLIQASGMDFPDNLEELLHTVLEQGTDEVDKVLGSYDLRHYQPLRKQVSYVATLGKVRALWVRHLADITEVIVSLPILTKGVPLFNQAIFEQHQQRIADFKADMRDAQRSLFQAASKEQLLEKADALCVQLDQNLAELAQTQALLYVAGYALRKLGKGGFSEIVGASAASAGILAREAISSFAAAQRITNRLVVDYPDEEVDELLDSSAEKSFDAGNIPDGKNTPLHHLSDTDDGAFVEVGGYVQAIEFGRIEGGTKLISLARLKDPSSGASATIAALFIHYRHIGLTTGCYVVANGLFHQSSALAGDTPAVEVDRLSLKTLAESNWRIAFLELSTPWFQVWRNGYNMRWSWGVHRPTGDFDGLGPEGAAEPVFVPFLRGGK